VLWFAFRGIHSGIDGFILVFGALSKRTATTSLGMPVRPSVHF
jgi:hypothetical protein